MAYEYLMFLEWLRDVNHILAHEFDTSTDALPDGNWRTWYDDEMDARTAVNKYFSDNVWGGIGINIEPQGGANG